MPKETHITIFDKILKYTVLWMIPRRVTPNQVTIVRFFSVPFVGWLLYDAQYYWGIILFCLSAFTDAIDGALARTRNQITEWGKVYDPIADKLLIGTSALIMLPRFLGFTIIALILFLEAFLIGTAYYRKNQGRQVSANAWGKTKMIAQSFGVALVLYHALTGNALSLQMGMYSFIIAIFFALISLITYGI